MRLQSSCFGQNYSLWRLDWGWRIHFQDHSIGSLAGGFSFLLCEPFYRTARDINDFPQSEWSETKSESKSEREGGHSIFYNLTFEVIYHHFCHNLLVMQNNRGTAWEETTQGCESQEARIIRGHFVGWLQYYFTLKKNRAIRKELPQVPTTILSNYQLYSIFKAIVMKNCPSCYLRPKPPPIH